MSARPPTTTVTPATTTRKFLIHGSPGSGKTPLATSLPWGAPWVGDRAVYIACDEKERGLAGTLPANRSRLITPDYGLSGSDPYSFIKGVLEYDWTTEGANVIIIDTATNASRDYFSAAINSSSYNTKAITFGTETIKMADKPHYGLAHNLMAKTVKQVKKCPLNVIMLFWSDYLEPEEGKGGGGWGGPLTINMNFSKDIAGEFGNILYTRTETVAGKTRYLCHTENHGIYVARLHGVLPNPIPVIEMKPDPVHVWEAIDKAQGINFLTTAVIP